MINMQLLHCGELNTYKYTYKHTVLVLYTAYYIGTYAQISTVNLY